MNQAQRSRRLRNVLLAFAIGLGGLGAASAQVVTGMGPSGTPGTFGSAGGLGGAPGRAGTLGGKGSLIGDGMGGFTIYQGRSRSRYLGPAQGPGTVHHPGGGTSSVIGDGKGGAIVSGPTGIHRHWNVQRNFSETR